MFVANLSVSVLPWMMRVNRALGHVKRMNSFPFHLDRNNLQHSFI